MIKAIENISYKITKFNKNTCDSSLFYIKSFHTPEYLFIYEKDIDKLIEILQLLKKTKHMF